MTNAPTTVEVIVALGGGFESYKQVEFAGETATNVVLGTLNAPVSITYNGSDPSAPKPATVWAVEYSVQNSGAVRITLLTKQVGQRINPTAVLGATWISERGR